MKNRSAALVITIVLFATLSPAYCWAQSIASQLRGVEKNLERWDLKEALRILDSLPEENRTMAQARHLKGWHAFLDGDYDKAQTNLSAATQQTTVPRHWLARLQLVQNTIEVTQNFKEIPSSKGHFIFAVHPGVDEVLIPYADQALEAAYEALGDTLMFRPEQPVRVEILGSIADLAAISPLKLSEIRTSGTIALCHFNRLIMVSPRALVYGYRWLDTLVHEYVHYVVAHRTGRKTPIWFDEGLAKYFESRWRTHTADPLSRMDEDRLATAIRKKSLIRFRAMSPSIAKLPSQEDAALAYAQVFTLVKLLMEKPIHNGINGILSAIQRGQNTRRAIGKAVGKSFTRFEKEWKQSLYARGLRRLPFATAQRKHYRDSHKPTDELEDIQNKHSRDLTYLGDRLAVNKRYKAAATEYGKALSLAGGPEPVVSAKLASALLKQGQHRKAIQTVGPAVRLSRHHVLLYLYRGKARLALGNYKAARLDLVEAVRINPFDPEVHGLLADVWEKLGQKDNAQMELRQQRLVMAN